MNATVLLHNAGVVMRTGVFTVFLYLIVASPAVAQDDGVFVDPDSPAGKEYAIPLEEARRHAAGGGSEGSSGGEPLFGAGIEPADRGGDAAQNAGRNGSGGGSGAGGGGSQASDGDQTVRRAVAIEAAAGGSSGGLLTAAIVALVLGAGLLAGLALRRALRSE